MDSLFRVQLDLWNSILLELPSPPTTTLQNWVRVGCAGQQVREFLGLGHKSGTLMTQGLSQPV